MYNKVYITELIPEESTEERQKIYSGIRKKLMSHKLTVTKTMDEAAYVIILFTRSYLKRRIDDILYTVPKLGIGHSVIFCDDEDLPPGELTLRDFVKHGTHDDLLKFVNYDDIKENPEKERRLQFLIYATYSFSRLTCFIMPGGSIIPNEITDIDSLINEHVDFTREIMNPLSVDMEKLVTIESAGLKIAALISKNVDTKGDTEVVIVSGYGETHDMTTITKFLTTEQLHSKSPGYNTFKYIKCPEEDPDTFAQSIIYQALQSNPLDLHVNFPHELHMYHPVYRFLIALDGINSINQLNGVSRLVDALNRVGPGNRVVLSTALGIFRDYKKNFGLPDSVFMGYIEESHTSGYQPGSVDNETVGWRPFCLLLHPSQFCDVMKVVKDRGEGTPLWGVVDYFNIST